MKRTIDPQSMVGGKSNSIKRCAALQKICVQSFRLKTALRSHDRGSALVETALILPVMMLLITGICSMGLALNSYLCLTHAVQAGAMQLAVSAGETGIDPCNMAATTVAAAAPTLNANNIQYTFTLNGTSVPSSGTFTGTANSTCSADTADLAPGTTVTVTASYPGNLLFFGWAPKSVSMTTSASEIAQ
jgi:Flp pilus assembly protein TadG